MTRYNHPPRFRFASVWASYGLIFLAIGCAAPSLPENVRSILTTPQIPRSLPAAENVHAAGTLPALPDDYSLRYARGVPFGYLVRVLYAPEGWRVDVARDTTTLAAEILQPINGNALASFLSRFAESQGINIEVRPDEKVIEVTAITITDRRVALFRPKYVSPEFLASALTERRDSGRDVGETKSDGGLGGLRIQAMPELGAVLIIGDDVAPAISLMRILDVKTQIQRVEIKALIVEARSREAFSASLSSVLGDLSVGANDVSGGLAFRIASGDFDSLGSVIADGSSISVISNPRAVVDVGEEASFEAGALVPTRGDVSVGEDGERISSISYQSSGLSLDIFLGSAGRGRYKVRVEQSLSAPTSNRLSSLDTPVFSVSSVSSTLTILDGTAVLLGGLRTLERDRSRFFLGRSRTTERRFLFVLLHAAAAPDSVWPAFELKP